MIKKSVKDNLSKTKANGKINKYSYLFHKKYDLSRVVREIQWKYSYSVIKENETVLFQGRYRIYKNGEKQIHFYVVERNNNKYVKIVDLKNLKGDFFGMITSSKNVPFCELNNIRVFYPEYKEKVKSIMEEYKLDSKIYDLLKKISKVSFKDYISEYFTCDFNLANVQYDCYDLINRRIFTADGYCLKKYCAYIELLDYILSFFKLNEQIPLMIKIIDSLDEAYKEIVEIKEEKDEFYSFPDD